MSAVFRLTPRQPEWIEGAHVVMDLVIENPTDSAIELPDPTYATSPQPRYTVTRPDGEEVSFVPDIREGEGDVSMIRIAPGASWKGDFSPGGYVDLADKGEYGISAHLDWNGVIVDAQTVPFRIVPMQIESVSASISQATSGSVVLECAMMQRTDTRRVALTALLAEDDPGNGEMRAPDLQDRGTLPDDTRAVHGVFANYATGFDPNRWIVSSTADRIHVATNLDSSRTEITANTTVRAILTPLATRGRKLHLFAILGEGLAARLAMARLDRSAGTVPAAALRALLDLQGPPLAAAAALAPETAGAVFVIAILSRTTEGARVQLVQVRADGAMPAVAQHLFDDVTPVGGLAVHWSSDGRVRAAFLGRFAGADALPELRITEVEFDATLAGNALARRIAIASDTPIDDVSVSYFERTPGRVARAVIARGGGTAWLATDGRPARRTTLPASGGYALIPGMEFWYGVWAAEGRLVVRAL